MSMIDRGRRDLTIVTMFSQLHMFTLWLMGLVIACYLLATQQYICFHVVAYCSPFTIDSIAHTGIHLLLDIEYYNGSRNLSFDNV